VYDKIWNDHLVHEADDGHLPDLYRPSSRPRGDLAAGLRRFARLEAQKFARPRRRSPWSTQRSDHDRTKPNPDPESAEQIRVMAENAKQFGIEYYNEFDKRQGIVHVIGPEQGFTLPGTTIVCGDSHTSTHGAFGALAHGIGTSESSTCWRRKP